MDHYSHNGSSRKRSRSPYRRVRDDDDDEKHVNRRRSRSPHGRKHKDRKEKLPFRSHHLHRHDLESYRTLFAEYLSLQKDLDIEDLSDRDIQGRWKSFLNKWNRGELAEGWYDPGAKTRADERASQQPPKSARSIAATYGRREHVQEADEDDDGYGPTLPPSTGARVGPSAPTFQDLQHRRELAEDDRENRIDDLRWDRKQDRKVQKERMEELVPRAEPGSRERQLEKKRDVAMSNRAFAESKEAGADDVGEGDLMGEEGGGFKARKQAMERQKNEREIRKEEILRARETEREEKLAEHRKKEEKTMEYLRTLAQQRYGGGS